jgi:hypothetical protein
VLVGVERVLARVQADVGKEGEPGSRVTVYGSPMYATASQKRERCGLGRLRFWFASTVEYIAYGRFTDVTASKRRASNGLLSKLVATL